MNGNSCSVCDVEVRGGFTKVSMKVGSDRRIHVRVTWPETGYASPPTPCREGQHYALVMLKQGVHAASVRRRKMVSVVALGGSEVRILWDTGR